MKFIVCLYRSAIPGRVFRSNTYYYSLGLTRLVEGGRFEGPASIVHLDNVSIRGQISRLAQRNVFRPRVDGESPLVGLEDFLASGEFEFPASNGFNHVRFVHVLGAHRDQDLSNRDTRGHSNGLSVRVAHPTREPIGAGATQHFIRPQDVKGVRADANVVIVLTNMLRQVLVNRHTTGLESFTRDLLLFVADQMSDKGKLIHRRSLVAAIENANLALWHTAAIARLDVRLVLLVTVTTRRTATHFDDCLVIAYLLAIEY